VVTPGGSEGPVVVTPAIVVTPAAVVVTPAMDVDVTDARVVDEAPGTRDVVGKAELVGGIALVGGTADVVVTGRSVPTTAGGFVTAIVVDEVVAEGAGFFAVLVVLGAGFLDVFFDTVFLAGAFLGAASANPAILSALINAIAVALHRIVLFSIGFP
jgi:hypothetical protein